MLLILFLPCYFSLYSSVPTFVTHPIMTKGLLNMKLDKQIISSSNNGKKVKWFKCHERKYCNELWITGKQNVSCEYISRIM